MEVLVAIIGVVSAFIGFLTAIVGRKKVIEYRYKHGSDSNPRRWYDNHFLVFLTIIFLYPLSLYALNQSNTISKGWKWFWVIAGWFIFMILISISKKILN